MKKLLLLMILTTAIQSQGIAAVSVESTTQPAVLQNSGYSKEITEMVNVGKARSNGLEYYTEKEKQYENQNKFVKFWRKFYVYTDPAAEDNSFYHHDTKTTPSYTDL